MNNEEGDIEGRRDRSRGGAEARIDLSDLTEEDFAAEVGAVLRQIRKARGLSLRQVTVRSRGQFKPSSIASYERGERQISLTRLFALADVYDVAAERVVAAIAHRLVRSGPDDGPDVQVLDPFSVVDVRRH
jgi:hypothetical protein